ncbi:hypothetical protein [Aequorivita sediminis]|uniref:hypothetical protein n=1 Tax=Aequorivita sediminis TaxID=3073653 RepID=UPI0028AA838B|nr:hypothetical protein [Aequorivita sp. F6058]
MKTLVISIMLSMTVTLISAQEVTVLDEARLIYAPQNTSITNDGDSYVYNVRDSQNRQFARNPIGFMKANFDIQNFINKTSDKNYIEYLVTFKGSNGSLMALFDKNGELLETRQQFKNVVIPAYIRNDIYDSYKGWTLTKTKYKARTKGEFLISATYKIHLEKGNDSQKLKIDDRQNVIGVALN